MGETSTVQTPAELEQFVASGRNGRRNAMADLGGIDLDPGAFKLAEQLANMETGEASGSSCSSSSQSSGDSSGASTSCE
jgi:hypothetical protein